MNFKKGIAQRGMIKIILGLITVFLLVGCGGIGEDVEKSTKSLENRVKNTDTVINKKEESLKKSKDFKIFNTYIINENLLNNFKESKKELGKAKEALTSLKKIVKEDEKKMRNIALGKIASINIVLKKSKELYNKPQNRINELKKAFKNAKNIKENAIKEKEHVITISNEIITYLEEQIKSNKNTSLKKDDLNEEIKKAKVRKEESKNTFKVIDEEFKKDKKMNISKFVDSSKKLKKFKKDSDTQKTSTTLKIYEVDNSYTKILSDMREDYYIQLGSTSWDNYYDSPTEHTTILPKIKVKKAFYERLANNTGVLATYSSGGIFGGLSVKISPTDWKILRVNPKRGLARGDDASEFWINDAPVELFHKYILVKNGVKTETDWIKVTEKEYEENYNNLGMSILTKPYGYYESDVIKTATPAGMAFVGNKRYGEWKEDSSGNSFWHYYGMYSFFTMGNRGYYRSDYNSYNTYRRTSPNRGYYGRNNSYGTFGTKTYSRKTPSRMRTRMSSSGFKKSSRNVRSTGRSSRGRGPGGGGK